MHAKDAHAFRVLEFQSIRDRLAAACETPLAAEAAASLRPAFRADETWYLVDLTREAHEALAKYSVPSLRSIRDPRNGLKRAEKGGTLGGQELRQIGEALSTMRSLKTFLGARREEFPLLYPYTESLPDRRDVEERLLDSLEGDGRLNDAASPALASIRSRKKAAAFRIAERIQSYTSRHRELLSDPIYTVRDGRYVVPLKAENRGKIKGIVHDTSSTGQTLFVEPEDVLQLGNALRELEAEERGEEARILAQLSKLVGKVAVEATGGIEAASQIDLAFGKARVAYDMKGCLPRAVPGMAYVAIQGGRHPLLDPEQAVPLDIEVGRGKSVLITGPNTGGKTVSIKCVGLTVLMVQCGLYPPALDVRLAPFTSVWADIGDEQSLEQSLSTFSGHIKNIAEALKRLEDGALVLLDEIGAGTDPAEGAALAKSILSEMSDKGATILASTHYGELKAFAYNVPGFTNAAMEFDPRTLRPTYRLLMGTPGASQALRIAERYGIPTPVVERARESLGDEAQDMAQMLERLESAQRQARLAQSEADRRANDLRKSEATAKRKLEEADEIRRTAHARAQEVVEAALREIRLEAARLFDEVKGAGKATESARKGLRELDAAGMELARSFAPKVRRPKNAPAVRKGSMVRLAGHSQVGHVLDDPKEGKVPVQLGSMKMTVPVSNLEPVDKAPQEVVKARSNIRLQKAINASPELDLRHLRAEEAIRELERYLDDAALAGLDRIRIVHGKGEGVLRSVVQGALKSHRDVSSYRDGEPAEGGAGVTIATLA